MDVAQLEQRLAGLDTPCLCAAEKALRTNLRVVDPAIRPINLGLQMLGRAHTVSCHEDFLTVMEGLKQASAGDVLVIDSRESHKVKSTAARKRFIEFEASVAHRTRLCGWKTVGRLNTRQP